MKRRHSLQTRIFLSQLAAGGLALILLTAMILMVVRTAMRHELSLRAMEITRFAAGECQYPLLVSDREELRKLATNILSGEGLLYFVVEGPDGKPIEEARHTISQSLPARPQSGTERTVQVDGADALEIVRPVESPQAASPFGWDSTAPAASLGTVRIAFSMSRQNALFRRIAGYGAAIALLLPLLVMPVQFWDVRRMLEPLRELARFAREVGEGCLEGQARVMRPDEVGEMTRAFNEMVGRLRTECSSAWANR